MIDYNSLIFFKKIFLLFFLFVKSPTFNKRPALSIPFINIRGDAITLPGPIFIQLCTLNLFHLL